MLKFAGCYHGHSDGLLAAGGSGVATLGLVGSEGVPASAVADTVVAPYNQVPELDERVACVIVEPVAANMGLVPPAPGFLEGLRAACDAVGTLLVFDEVITGFRIGPAGASGYYAVRPDLWCFGKVIGGGLPVGAFGGRADVLCGARSRRARCTRPALCRGTPLRLLPDEQCSARSARTPLRPSQLGLPRSRRRSRNRSRRRSPRPVRSTSRVADSPRRCPSSDRSSESSSCPRGPATWSTSVERQHRPRRVSTRGWFGAMLERGVALAPGPYEVLFPSMAHGRAELDQALETATAAIADVLA